MYSALCLISNGDRTICIYLYCTKVSAKKYSQSLFEGAGVIRIMNLGSQA